MCIDALALFEKHANKDWNFWTFHTFVQGYYRSSIYQMNTLFVLLALIQHNSSTICEHTSKTASGFTGTYPTTRLPTVHHYSYKKLAWDREGGGAGV